MERRLCSFSCLFSRLWSTFFFHIFFAMYDFEFLFQLVALTITISIFFMGPIILLISQESHDFYDEKLFICLCFSPILGFGLGWAYSGMEFAYSVIIFSFVNTLIHLGYKRGFKYLWEWKETMPESPIKVNNPKSEDTAGPNPEQTRQMEQAYKQMKRKMQMESVGKGIKHKIMVLSGKGGVGKSTVATGLALSLAAKGLKVGLLDIDITGPNVPKMMNLDGQRLNVESGRILPAVGPNGVKVISMAFLLEDESTPVVWRGPIKLGAIQQFIGDVDWGNLDFLVIDFPPGTSDEPLTVAQSLPNIDGMVVVTTPQEVALLDSRKSIGFAESLKVPIIGVVENMSGYTLRGKGASGSVFSVLGPGGKDIDVTVSDDGSWAVTLDIFKSGGGASTAEKTGVPFLGALPFDPGVVRGGDDGVHRIIAEPEGESAKAFSAVVEKIEDFVSQDQDSDGLEII